MIFLKKFAMWVGFAVLGIIGLGIVGTALDDTDNPPTTTVAAIPEPTTIPETTTTTAPPTTTTTRHYVVHTQPPASLSDATITQLFIDIIREESDTYPYFTFIDVLNDSDLKTMLSLSCEARSLGSTSVEVALVFMSGYDDPPGTAEDGEYDLAGYVFGAAFEACRQMEDGGVQ